MPLILGANTLTAGGYEVDNSLRFNSGSSDYLSRSLGASETSIQKGTFSFWVKRSSLTSASSEMIYSNEVADDNNRGFIQFEDNDSFRMVDTAGGVNQLQLKTNRLFRDVSAWYHIVVAIDTTQSTASDRLKIYINGVQETSFSTETYPDQNDNLKLLEGGQTNKNLIGLNYGGSAYFGGYLAEFVYIDGTQNAVTDFGEFDEDSGIWKPINVSGLTFGNNGFFLEFKDSSALGDDTSGKGNDFTVNNLTSIDQTTDTPTNNFATANPLHFNATIPSAGTLSDGNLTFTSSQGASAYPAFYSTIGASQGKWYAEFKVTTANSAIIGIGSGIATGGFLGGGLYDYAYYYDGTFYNNGSNQGTQSSYTDGDIISVAMDLDNNKIYVAKDNVWQHSGDPSAGTGGFVITAPASNNTGTYLIAYGDAGGGTPAIQGNFGNPPFAITTGNEDANGYGNFEYEVPPGYYALNTKI
jgi:hypothetical protein